MITNDVPQRGAAAATKGQKSSQSAASARKSTRGFAAMDPAQQKRIASEGGKASHASGRGHRFTSEEARAAGRKGGMSNRTRNEPSSPAARS
ncbi:KGG domain-containing protein [Hymenobacter sp. BT491]|uniref:KGG domain-containing protein n=1 Tax=Hymenobacter sp. BT491 TaxID=2766779 RepID=UPI0016539DCB|nr:KGG domain-containing protein [Hymenobacter sp. BT491]MBC6989333.1 general stress protein [Hymenobacter sp. BT491]